MSLTLNLNGAEAWPYVRLNVFSSRALHLLCYSIWIHFNWQTRLTLPSLVALSSQCEGKQLPELSRQTLLPVAAGAH